MFQTEQVDGPSGTVAASSWGSDGFASFSLNDVAQTGSK